MRKALRIAVADDESGMIALYHEALTDLGHEVFVAGDGRQLVELCRRERPNLIITDLQMPRLDGLAAVRQVNHEGLVPAILVSAADLSEHVLPACVRLVLRKPICLSDLKEAVRVFLQTSTAGTPRSAFARTEPDGP